MARKKIQDLKNLTDIEVATKLRETDEALFKVKLQKVTGQLNNTAEIWKLRKLKARILTFKTARSG